MTQVAWVTNAPPESGVGHYAAALQPLVARALTEKGIGLDSYFIHGEGRKLTKDKQVLAQVSAWPGLLGQKSMSWLRLGRLLRRHFKSDAPALVHLTNQTLSFLAAAVPPHVITVHDILELTHPQSSAGSLAARLLYRNMSRAAHLACVSDFTAQQVKAYLGSSMPPLTVVPNGVSADFHPIEDFPHTIGYATLRQELRLTPADRVVLYVGSEHPRKDVATALRAFARCLAVVPNLVFIKVGAAGLPAGREATLQAIEELKLRAQVRFLPTVSLARLNELFNLASVFVYPSTYEGFGLPPLQAMAAGTPVVTSNSNSLPEVVGDGGVLVGPGDVDAFADALLKILQDTEHAAELRQRGSARAALFTWERAAEEIIRVYEPLLT